MRIDRTHKPWALVTAGILAAASIVYMGTHSGSRPSGGTTPGLVFGVIGYGLMLYAALLGARKKVPVVRLGRAQTWMRGHLWMGLLSFPIILLHAGFAFKGPLTAVLMVLFAVVVFSGLFGAVVQHYLPALMTSRVPLETIYEEIPHIRKQLREEADHLVTSIAGRLNPGDVPSEPADIGTQLGVTVLVEVQPDDRDRFRRMYIERLRPFLDKPDAVESEFVDPEKSKAAFDYFRQIFPAPVHSVLRSLESIVDEEQQLRRQKRMYVWLHSWLLVHVPASIALLILGAIHAVVALRY